MVLINLNANIILTNLYTPNSKFILLIISQSRSYEYRTGKDYLRKFQFPFQPVIPPSRLN